MKTFDFESMEFKKNGVIFQEFLRANHDKPITEAEFVEMYRKSAGSAKHRSPSYGKAKYRYIVKKFGFFSPLPPKSPRTKITLRRYERI